MTMHHFVVRAMPLTNDAMIVDAMSRHDGKLTAYVNGKTVDIGFDTYAASESVELDTAKKIVQAFAAQRGIPEASIVVRHRLPKSNAATVSVPRVRKARKTHDANLNVQTAQQPQAAQQQDALASAAQALHDKETKPAENKTRRAYKKRDKEKSARSIAALKRYQQDVLRAAQAEAQSANDLPQQGVEKQAANTPAVNDTIMELAVAIAKLLSAKPDAGNA